MEYMEILVDFKFHRENSGNVEFLSRYYLIIAIIQNHNITRGVKSLLLLPRIPCKSTDDTVLHDSKRLWHKGPPGSGNTRMERIKEV